MSPRAAQLTGDEKEAELPRQAEFTHLTQEVFDERWFVYRRYLPKAQIKIITKTGGISRDSLNNPHTENNAFSLPSIVVNHTKT